MDTQTTRAGWALGLGAIASLMVALDAMVVSTALTEIGREFHASIEALEWTVNGYILTFAVLLLTMAALGERFGRRRLFASGLLLFSAASAACALAPTVEWLIAARVIQGIGAAMIMPLALALVSAAYPPEKRGRALGIYSAVTALSSVIGPIVGGAITQGLSWQWIFWLNLPIGLVAAGLAFARLEESFGAPAKLDLRGLVLVTASAFGLVWGLMRGNAGGWQSVEIVTSIGGSLVLLAVFIGWERRTAQPMMPLRLFADRTFAAGNLAMFLLNGAGMAALFFMAQFQQVSLGQDALHASLKLLPWGATLTLVATRSMAVANRLGERSTVVLGLMLQAVGLAWMALLASPDVPFVNLIVPMIVAGAGFALAIPVAQKIVVGAVSPADIGKASGTLSMIRQLGGTFGIAATVAAFAMVGSHASPAAFAQGYQAANLLAGLLSALGAAAALALPGRSSAPFAAAKVKLG